MRTLKEKLQTCRYSKLQKEVGRRGGKRNRKATSESSGALWLSTKVNLFVMPKLNF